MSEPHKIVEDKDLTFPPVYEDTMRCPRCLTSWQGEPIPVENQKYYGNLSHFSMLIGIEISGIYDGIHHWKCPTCKTTFPRCFKNCNGKVVRMFNDNLHLTDKQT